MMLDEKSTVLHYRRMNATVSSHKLQEQRKVLNKVLQTMYNTRNKVPPREENSSPEMYVLKTEAYISQLLVTEEGAVKFVASKKFNRNLSENVTTAMSCCT